MDGHKSVKMSGCCNFWCYYNEEKIYWRKSFIRRIIFLKRKVVWHIIFLKQLFFKAVKLKLNSYLKNVYPPNQSHVVHKEARFCHWIKNKKKVITTLTILTFFGRNSELKSNFPWGGGLICPQNCELISHSPENNVRILRKKVRIMSLYLAVLTLFLRIASLYLTIMTF